MPARNCYNLPMCRWIIAVAACLALWTLPVRAQSLADLVNSFRANRGLPRLTWNNQLAAAAANQAQWMAAGNEPGRRSDHSQGGSSSALSRAQATGFTAPLITEIIYKGGNANHAMEWWQTSAIHLRELTRSATGHVGSASAPGGNNQTAHVVVFGWTSSANPASGGNATGQQPAYVIGLDEFGNIKHEIQPGDDLGMIALRYGYNWDVIPTIRALNNRTQDEDNLLAPGDTLLVPPKAGTYTPAPQTATAQSRATVEPAQEPEETMPPSESVPSTAAAKPNAPAATPQPRPTDQSMQEIRIGRLPTPIATPVQSTIPPGHAASLLEIGLLALAALTQVAVIGVAAWALLRR